MNINVNSKTIRLLFIFSTIITLLLCACQEMDSRLEVLSLAVAPTTIMIGEKAKVTAIIRNNGENILENYNVPLMINGVADNRKYIALAPGESDTIEFSLQRNNAGTYNVSIGEQAATLEVRKPQPATFELSGLEINPSETNILDKVVITANLANSGEVKGKYTADLIINGTVDQRKENTYPPGSGYMLVFKIYPETAGTYVVKLGNLTGQFTVLEPVTPTEVTPVCPPSTQWNSIKKC